MEYHIFAYRFRASLDISGVSKEVFDTWCDNIATGFITRNIMALLIKECDRIPGVIIDTRSFIEIEKSNNEQQVCYLYQKFFNQSLIT